MNEPKPFQHHDDIRRDIGILQTDIADMQRQIKLLLEVTTTLMRLHNGKAQ